MMNNLKVLVKVCDILVDRDIETKNLNRYHNIKCTYYNSIGYKDTAYLIAVKNHNAHSRFGTKVVYWINE